MTQKKRLFDGLFVSSFLFLLATCSSFISPYFMELQSQLKNLSYLSIGIGYDILVAAELSLLAYLFNFFNEDFVSSFCC